MRRKRLLLAWTEARLSEVVEINPPKPENPPDDDTPVSFVPMAAVQVMAGGMDASETRPWRDVRKGYKRFQDGDVLFAKITPCMENGKLRLRRGSTTASAPVPRSSTCCVRPPPFGPTCWRTTCSGPIFVRPRERR